MKRRSVLRAAAWGVPAVVVVAAAPAEAGGVSGYCKCVITAKNVAYKKVRLVITQCSPNCVLVDGNTAVYKGGGVWEAAYKGRSYVTVTVTEGSRTTTVVVTVTT